MVINFILGAVFASFVTCLAFRINQKISLLDRSFCDWCRLKIPIIYLIPVFGYLLSLGRCSNCRQKIPFKYFAFEIMTGLFFIFENNFEMRFLLLLLLFLSEEDFFDQTSNSWLLFLITPLFLLNGENNFVFLFLLVAFLYVAAIIFEAIGVGDIPVLLVLFLAAGQSGFLLIVLIASLLGFIFSQVKAIQKIPFIPFLMYGFYISRIIFLF